MGGGVKLLAIYTMDICYSRESQCLTKFEYGIKSLVLSQSLFKETPTKWGERYIRKPSTFKQIVCKGRSELHYRKRVSILVIVFIFNFFPQKLLHTCSRAAIPVESTKAIGAQSRTRVW